MNEQQVVFVERISAAATHEIMNSLASVGQSSGLMQDLLTLGVNRGWRAKLSKIFGSGSKAQEPGQRLQKSLLAVNHSLEKTMRTTRALNRFLHSLTPSKEPLSASQALQIIAELMQPFARQKRTELKLLQCPAENPCPISPLLIYQALAACIESLLQQTSNDQLSLDCQCKDEVLSYIVRSAQLQPADKDIPPLEGIAPKLAAQGCQLEVVTSGLALNLPCKL
jgi:signal transduction histidine kinase